jgi:hypothetical protein
VVTVVSTSDWWLRLSRRVIGGYCCQSEYLVVTVVRESDLVVFVV